MSERARKQRQRPVAGAPPEAHSRPSACLPLLTLGGERLAGQRQRQHESDGHAHGCLLALLCWNATGQLGQVGARASKRDNALGAAAAGF